jgi:hypothetical protein
LRNRWRSDLADREYRATRAPFTVSWQVPEAKDQPPALMMLDLERPRVVSDTDDVLQPGADGRMALTGVVKR